MTTATKPKTKPKTEPASKKQAATQTKPTLPTLTLPAKPLLAALKDVMGAIENKVSIPILNHVLIESGTGEVVLTGTDLDMWVRRTLACETGSGAAFTLCLPAKPLADILATLDGDAEVTLTAPSAEDPRVTLKSGRSRFRLAQLPRDDFPLPVGDPAAGDAFEMPCSQLADALSAVAHAISTEETRYYLNGVYVHAVSGMLRFAATDGHRLARAQEPAPDGAGDWAGHIWQRRSAGVLAKLLAAAVKAQDKDDPAQVLVQRASDADGALVRFALPASDGGEVDLTAKTIDGTFPDYTRVIPADPPRTALVNRTALAAAIRRVSSIADSNSRAVKAAFTADKLTLTTRCPDLGEAEAEVPCTATGPGGNVDIAIGFNGDYWLAALAAIAIDDVAMKAGAGPGDPVMIGSPGAMDGEGAEARLIQVLMPVRVA